MSKVRQAFARGKAFIPFVTCGDPSLAVTEALVLSLIHIFPPARRDTGRGQDARTRAAGGRKGAFRA